VSAYPVMLDGESLSAVVVGGGVVATRKVRALVDAGATVHVVALSISREIRRLAEGNERLTITKRPYESSHLGDAMLVIAATDDTELNARIARDARGRLVNVASAPELGNVATPAVHRAGDIVIAITAGRLPSAASRLRDAIGQRFDARYGDAVAALSSLRRTLIGAGQRDLWSDAADALVGENFCELVESGELDARMAAWR